MSQVLFEYPRDGGVIIKYQYIPLSGKGSDRAGLWRFFKAGVFAGRKPD
jgi:hypothetical protein